jgi:hypothetical protein
MLQRLKQGIKIPKKGSYHWGARAVLLETRGKRIASLPAISTPLRGTLSSVLGCAKWRGLSGDNLSRYQSILLLTHV